MVLPYGSGGAHWVVCVKKIMLFFQVLFYVCYLGVFILVTLHSCVYWNKFYKKGEGEMQAKKIDT